MNRWGEDNSQANDARARNYESHLEQALQATRTARA
jgi:hypothetical protein